MAWFKFYNLAFLPISDGGTLSKSINAYGTQGTITSMRIELGMYHDDADDLDILLVAPDGTSNLVFWSDAGGSNALANSYTFVDGGTALPDNSPIGIGIFLAPTAYPGTETDADFGSSTGGLAFAAPDGSANLASQFNGLGANGAWTFYFHDDDLNGLSGTQAGLSLTLTTDSNDVNLAGTAAADTITLFSYLDTNGNQTDSGIWDINGDQVDYSGPGGSFTVDGGDGNDTITGSLRVETILGGNNNDTISGGGSGDTLDGGPGIDTVSYQNDTAGVTVDLAAQTVSGTGAEAAGDTISEFENVTGTAFADTLGGSTAANTLTGLGGDDTLTGLGGADKLYGGPGNDVLHIAATEYPNGAILDGGADSDTLFVTVPAAASFHYVNFLNTTITGIENLHAEGPSPLTLGFDAAGFTFSSFDVAARGGAHTFIEIYLNTVNALDLSGLTVSGLIAGDLIFVQGYHLDDTITGSSWDDHLRGGSGNDILSGGGGADELRGEGNNDELDGGPGADVLMGGPGDDTYRNYESADTVIELTGEGFDTVEVAYNFVVDPLLFANVEAFSLTGSATMLTGNDLAQTLNGNPAVGSTLFGFDGNDTLNGGAGQDWLDGGPGDDAMAGGDGNDFYYVAQSGDTVTETPGGGALDTVYAYADWTMPANVEILVMRGSATNVSGSAGFNRIYGTANADTISAMAGDDVIYAGGGADMLFGGPGNDRLDGGPGADTMTGGADNDIYIVNDPGDVVIENPGEGTDTIYAYVDYTAAANVENLILRGAAHVATGNAEANSIAGTTGNDTLTGFAGNDKLFGKAGNDTLSGGDNNDRLYGDRGQDMLTGGAGLDQFFFRETLDSSNQVAFADRITDFTQAHFDRIVLTDIDADETNGAGSNESFAFIGSDPFTAPGQVRYEQVGGDTHVFGNTDADLFPEFSIVLTGTITLTSGDFFL